MDQLPPTAPQGFESIWPTLQWLIPLLLAACASVWSFIQMLAAKKIESQLESEKSKNESMARITEQRVSLEVARMQGEFERTKDFQQDLVDDCKTQREANSKLLTQVQELLAVIGDKDRTIKDQQVEIRSQDKEIVELRKQVAELRAELNLVREQIKTMSCARPECPNRIGAYERLIRGQTQDEVEQR